MLQTTGVCTTKLALLNACAILTRAYARDVATLHQVTVKAFTGEAYGRFREAAEIARVQAENARQAFEKHITEHGC